MAVELETDGHGIILDRRDAESPFAGVIDPALQVFLLDIQKKLVPELGVGFTLPAVVEEIGGIAQTDPWLDKPITNFIRDHNVLIHQEEIPKGMKRMLNEAEVYAVAAIVDQFVREVQH